MPTPAMAHRMATLGDDLAATLFVLMTLGDDRAVRATYVAGDLGASRGVTALAVAGRPCRGRRVPPCSRASGARFAYFAWQRRTLLGYGARRGKAARAMLNRASCCPVLSMVSSQRFMARPDTQYVCQSCGAVHAKWAGRCDACGEWNTLAEESAPAPVPKGMRAGAAQRLQLVGLAGASAGPARLSTAIAELDRVLGGGLVHGSTVLLGGDPGIGKSTLVLAGGGRAGARRGGGGRTSAARNRSIRSACAPPVSG